MHVHKYHPLKQAQDIITHSSQKLHTIVFLLLTPTINTQSNYY